MWACGSHCIPVILSKEYSSAGHDYNPELVEQKTLIPSCSSGLPVSDKQCWSHTHGWLMRKWLIEIQAKNRTCFLFAFFYEYDQKETFWKEHHFHGTIYWSMSGQSGQCRHGAHVQFPPVRKVLFSLLYRNTQGLKMPFPWKQIPATWQNFTVHV